MNEYTRSEPSRVAGERTSLTDFLDYQRQTLAMKCSGLNADQLRQKVIPPSPISLLGLVRHLANVERSWFQNVMNGDDIRGYRGRRADGEFAEFDVDIDEADPDEAFDVWHAACARSRDIVDAAESLDIVGHYGEEESRSATSSPT